MLLYPYIFMHTFLLVTTHMIYRLQEGKTNVSSIMTSSTPDFLLTSLIIWYFRVPGSFFCTYWETSVRSSTTWGCKSVSEGQIFKCGLRTLSTFPACGEMIAIRSIWEVILKCLQIWKVQLKKEGTKSDLLEVCSVSALSLVIWLGSGSLGMGSSE